MCSTVTCGAAQVNPNSYYDTMGRPGQRGGERERQLATFARNAVVAAEASKLCTYPLMQLFPSRGIVHEHAAMPQTWTSFSACSLQAA